MCWQRSWRDWCSRDLHWGTRVIDHAEGEIVVAEAVIRQGQQDLADAPLAIDALHHEAGAIPHRPPSGIEPLGEVVPTGLGDRPSIEIPQHQPLQCRCSHSVWRYELAVGIELALQQARTGYIQFNHHLGTEPRGICIQKAIGIRRLEKSEAQGIPWHCHHGPFLQSRVHGQTREAVVVLGENSQLPDLISGLRLAVQLL